LTIAMREHPYVLWHGNSKDFKREHRESSSFCVARAEEIGRDQRPKTLRPSRPVRPVGLLIDGRRIDGRTRHAPVISTAVPATGTARSPTEKSQINVASKSKKGISTALYGIAARRDSKLTHRDHIPFGLSCSSVTRCGHSEQDVICIAISLATYTVPAYKYLILTAPATFALQMPLLCFACFSPPNDSSSVLDFDVSPGPPRRSAEEPPPLSLTAANLFDTFPRVW
jgi:hypothetical protein